MWKHQAISSALYKLIMYKSITKQSKIVASVNGKNIKYFLSLQVPSCRGHLLGLLAAALQKVAKEMEDLAFAGVCSRASNTVICTRNS